MIYKGSCHCGRIAFEVDGDLTQVVDCNCSICSRKGWLLWFVPEDKFRLLTPRDDLATYAFGKKAILHRFCPTCGIHPFGERADPADHHMIAVNVRCLEGVDLSILPVIPYDGRSL